MLWPPIAWPWTAAFPALLFAFLAYRTGRRGLWLTAFLWAGYGLYELQMYRRVFCTGECNIRIDLLPIIPVLLLRTISGLRSVWRARG